MKKVLIKLNEDYPSPLFYIGQEVKINYDFYDKFPLTVSGLIALPVETSWAYYLLSRDGITYYCLEKDIIAVDK